jgi:hypothetical protein
LSQSKPEEEMQRQIAICLVISAFLFGASALAPLAGEAGPLAASQATATVNKSYARGGGGGGNVSGAGDRLGTLLSGWAVPVLTVLAGCLLVGALASRNIGASVGIVVITLLGLIFLLAPQSVESFAKGIANTVF